MTEMVSVLTYPPLVQCSSLAHSLTAWVRTSQQLQPDHSRTQLVVLLWNSIPNTSCGWAL